VRHVKDPTLLKPEARGNGSWDHAEFNKRIVERLAVMERHRAYLRAFTGRG
jgi:hypothetical protein